MARDRQRVCLQDGLKLDLNRLARQHIILRGGSTSGVHIEWNHSYWGRIDAGKVSSNMSDPLHGWLRIQLTDLDQHIHLVSRPRHFGGAQWYFVCPVTNRDVSVVWKPPGARRFCSRQTWKRQVAYRSQFMGPTDRAHYGKDRIKRQLIADLDPDEWDLPPKPKRMRWKTYDRYSEHFDRYEEMLDYGCALLAERLIRGSR